MQRAGILLSLAVLSNAGGVEAQPRPVVWNNPDGPKVPGAQHGVLYSKAMDLDVGYNVWLPPSYADSRDRYPVIYFLHGAGGNENSDVGGFSGLVLKAIQARQIPPVICVFPNGGMSGYADDAATRIMGETLIVSELVPEIDAKYRTVAGRGGRALAGFSMGGGGAVRLALKYPSRFSAAGSLAGAFRFRGGTDPAGIARDNRERLKDSGLRLMLVVGDQDPTFAGHTPLVAALSELSLPVEYRVLPNVGHNLGAYYDQAGADLVRFVGARLQGTAAAQPAPPLVSPQVGDDRRVTFRLRAPNATAVSVSGDWPGGPQPLAKDEQGIWTATVGPLEPDLYGYSLLVDGFRTLDPANAWVKPMRSPTTSVVEVPGSPPRLSEWQDVPHGTVRLHEYRSRVLDRRRGLFVYTPPAYDRDPDARYPVLYLFHGSGDNEATWTVLGRAHLILDNLIAQGKAQPMLIVMPDGHAVPPGGAEGRMRNIEAFARDLLEEVLPFVETNYGTRPGPENRAIVGLSMGGGQSLTIGLNHPELFAWVGGFSASIGNPETTVAAALADPAATNSRLRLLWIACGKDDRLVENARDLDGRLTEKGIRHEFQVTEGNHSWPVWRRYLPQFAERLFR
jgi:enterochelin esterase family protein